MHYIFLYMCKSQEACVCEFTCVWIERCTHITIIIKHLNSEGYVITLATGFIDNTFSLSKRPTTDSETVFLIEASELKYVILFSS